MEEISFASMTIIVRKNMVVAQIAAITEWGGGREVRWHSYTARVYHNQKCYQIERIYGDERNVCNSRVRMCEEKKKEEKRSWHTKTI